MAPHREYWGIGSFSTYSRRYEILVKTGELGVAVDGALSKMVPLVDQHLGHDNGCSVDHVVLLSNSR